MVRALGGGVAPDGPEPSRPLWRGVLGALAALVVLGASCGPRPGVPPDVAVPPAPFVRLPYVQGVEDDRAVIRWRPCATEPPAPGSAPGGRSYSSASPSYWGEPWKWPPLRGRSAG